MMNEAFRGQLSVLLRILELTAKLLRCPGLEDHRRLRVGEAPSRGRRQPALRRCLGSARWRMRTRPVFRLVTIGALHREDAIPVGAAPKPEEVMLVAVVALER